MSYNTRRTGSGGGANDARRGTTTQVNYHQQPARTMSNTPQPRNTAGYTTAPQQAASTYNSAAQPVYSTQPAYSTAPPLPKTAPPPQQPAAQTAKPVTPIQPARPATATPVAVKPEPITPQNTPKMEENGDGSEKRVFKRKPFVKVSGRVKKARLNARIRRILIPKSALSFLHELRPQGYTFTHRAEPGWGFTATCTVDGQTFMGKGASITKAKNHASEMALRHLMMEELAKSPFSAGKKEDSEVKTETEAMEVENETEGGESKPKKKIEEDSMPWCSLAAFAIHKLFDDWQKDGTEESMEQFGGEAEDDFYSRPDPGFFSRTGGFGPGPRPPFPPGRGRGFGPFSGPPRGYSRGFSTPRIPFSTGSFYSKFSNPNNRPHQPPQPSKKTPEDPSKVHPVMMLHQLKPTVEYNVTQEGFLPNPLFVASAQVDGQQFTGRGRNKKEAKKQAAIAALVPLGIKYDNE